MDSFFDMENPPETMLRVFDCNSSNDPMHLIVLFEQQFGEVRPVLAGNAGN
jgi:hypothetical protein